MIQAVPTYPNSCVHHPLSRFLFRTHVDAHTNLPLGIHLCYWRTHALPDVRCHLRRYEMCALRPAFNGATFDELGRKIKGAKYRPIPSMYSEVPLPTLHTHTHLSEGEGASTYIRSSFPPSLASLTCDASLRSAPYACNSSPPSMSSSLRLFAGSCALAAAACVHVGAFLCLLCTYAHVLVSVPMPMLVPAPRPYAGLGHAGAFHAAGGAAQAPCRQAASA